MEIWEYNNSWMEIQLIIKRSDKYEIKFKNW